MDNMNKAEKFEIFRRLDTLFSYSDLLPDEFKSKFISDLDEVRKRISSHKCAVDENVKIPADDSSIKNIESSSPLSFLSPSSKPFVTDKSVPENNNFVNKPFSFKPLTEEEKRKQKEESDYDSDSKPSIKGTKPLVAPPHSTGNINVNAFTNYKKPGTGPLPSLKEVEEKKINHQDKKDKPTINLEPSIKKSSFEAITGVIIPKLTEAGKKLMGDLSVPIESYLVLKMIDDKNTLFKLFENYNKKHNSSFLDFANTLYALELDRHVSFTKTETTVKDMGIIKIEELLEFGKVVSETAMVKGVEYQKAKSMPFIGKALIELKYMTENTLGLCMKIQKWVSRTFEKAEYVAKEEVIITPLVNTEDISVNKQNLVPLQQNRPMNIPASFIPTPKEEKPNIPVFDFIVPIFNQKGKDILENEEYQVLANKIKFLDTESSILDSYWNNRESFKKNILTFLKFLIKLDSQEIFSYQGNKSYQEKIIWVRFGDLLTSLGLISQAKTNEAFEYSEENNCYIGEAIVKLGFMEQEQIDEYLKVQNWLNTVLSKVSYERVFVDAIQSVLKSSFSCNVDIGSLRKVTFQQPLKDIVYIKYNISGKLNGRVFYISDRAFMQRLANTLMNSVGNNSQTQEFDESYVATVCTVIIGNSLTKLAQMGLFSSSEIPKIIMEKEVTMDKEIIVADNNTISMIPMINEFGRFAIGLEIAE